MPADAVYLRFTFCVSAEAATDFTFAGVFGFESSLEAVDATRFDVVSFAFLDMVQLPFKWLGFRKKPTTACIGYLPRGDADVGLFVFSLSPVSGGEGQARGRSQLPPQYLTRKRIGLLWREFMG